MNLYEDKNAFWNQTEWRQWPRPYFRDNFGNTVATEGDWAHLELAMGTKDRSGEYFDWQDATWGPQGTDGYPLPRWNPLTGEVDHRNLIRVPLRDSDRHTGCEGIRLDAYWLGECRGAARSHLVYIQASGAERPEPVSLPDQDGIRGR